MNRNRKKAAAATLAAGMAVVLGAGTVMAAASTGDNGLQKEETVSEPSAPKKKYTRRNLVVKPEEAISEQEIACCICGKTFQNLTTKHIQSHDLTVEEYKKLCGYGPEQKLISSKLLNKLQANVLKAQQAREKKKAE
jgi:predicted transcriptional regulator